MKKLTSFLLAAAMTASSFAALLTEDTIGFAPVTAYAADEAEPTATPDTSESPAPTEDATETPSASAEPAATEDSNASASPEATATPTPEPTQTAEPVVYVARSGGSVLLSYENGEFTAEAMIASNDAASSMKLVNNDRNFVPFRYLFEKFGFNDQNNNLGINYDDISTVDEATLEGHTGFVYGLKNGVFTIMVKTDDDLHEIVNGKPVDGLEGVDDSVFMENDTTYVPLRTVGLIGYNVEYDSETDAIFISQSKLETGQSNLLSEVKNEYKSMFNDNYATYAYAYIDKNNGENYTVTGLNAGGRAYCVNQYGDMLVYADNELYPNVTLLKNESREMETKPIVFDGSTDVIIDKIIYDGRKIYGVIMDSIDSSYGTLFEAELNIKVTDKVMNFYAENIKYLRGVDARYPILKTVGNTRYMYYIDYNDWETVKRIAVDSAVWTPETVTDSSGTPLRDITHFGIVDGYMLYCYQANAVRCAKLDATGRIATPHIDAFDVEYGLNGMLSDDTSNCFYFIEAEDDGGNINTVYRVSMEEADYVQYDKIMSGNRVRNIAIIDGKLYGVVGTGENAIYDHIPSITE